MRTLIRSNTQLIRPGSLCPRTLPSKHGKWKLQADQSYQRDGKRIYWYEYTNRDSSLAINHPLGSIDELTQKTYWILRFDSDRGWRVTHSHEIFEVGFPHLQMTDELLDSVDAAITAHKSTIRRG